MRAEIMLLYKARWHRLYSSNIIVMKKSLLIHLVVSTIMGCVHSNKDSVL